MKCKEKPQSKECKAMYSNLWNTAKYDYKIARGLANAIENTDNITTNEATDNNIVDNNNIITMTVIKHNY